LCVHSQISKWSLLNIVTAKSKNVFIWYRPRKPDLFISFHITFTCVNMTIKALFQSLFCWITLWISYNTDTGMSLFLSFLVNFLCNKLNLPNPSSCTRPWGFSASKSSECRGKKCFRGVKRGQHHHLWADCLGSVGSSTSHNPIGLQPCYEASINFWE
jgi:hypothetical protein